MNKFDEQKNTFLTEANKFALTNNVINLALSVSKGLEILKDNQCEDLITSLNCPTKPKTSL